VKEDFMRDYASFVLRVALALTFLYSVADRFGWIGPPGAANVSWGNFSHFTAYVGLLNWFLPHSVIAVLAWIDTSLEVLLALMLLAGLWLRAVSFVSGLLLLTFATAMSVASGIGAPFQYSVFTAAAAAFLLASQPSYRRCIYRGGAGPLQERNPSRAA
jgi:putative oxidoreductase